MFILGLHCRNHKQNKQFSLVLEQLSKKCIYFSCTCFILFLIFGALKGQERNREFIYMNSQNDVNKSPKHISERKQVALSLTKPIQHCQLQWKKFTQHRRILSKFSLPNHTFNITKSSLSNPILEMFWIYSQYEELLCRCLYQQIPTNC